MLFLASRGLQALPQFMTDHGVPLGTEAVWIPTAANSLSGAATIRAHARQDLSAYVTPLEVDLDRDNAEAIKSAKIIVVSGGDSIHLMKRMRTPRVAAMLKAAVKRGVPYVGLSAGAVVAGPSLVPYGGDMDGLGLVPVVVLPHAGKRAAHDTMLTEFGARFPLLLLRDDQAAIGDASGVKVIPS